MRCKIRYVLLTIILSVTLTLGLYYWRESIHQHNKSEMAPKHSRSILPANPNVKMLGDRPMSRVTQTTYVRLQGVDSVGHDMLLVHGASVDQLKNMCSSLEDCEGFNSEGWVKSRVDSKHRVDSIDLYVKHRVAHERGRTRTDMDAGVFMLHITNYDSMDKNLKIYIYDTDIGQDMPSYADYKYGVEYLFISLLAKSKFRTKDPQEATFYFIPARCSAYRKSVTSLTDGIDRAADTMSRMVDHIKTEYPYWNLSLGTDHFYLCAHDMGADLVKRSDPNLWKNSIGLLNTADSSEPMFVPHKDISLPPHPGRGVIDWATIGQGGEMFDPNLRTKLAFMAGHPGRGPVRPLLYELFEDDDDFHMVKGYISDKEYMHALKTTKFCLCPRGNKAWSPRLMDALWFGCIPVIIADHYVLPLSSVVDWSKVAITVKEQQAAELKVLLQSISDDQLVEMQIAIQTIGKHLTWNDPPQPYDAFHSVLFELWQKQNVWRKGFVF